MKKSFFVVLLLAILSTPIVILGVINIMRVKPEVRPINESPVSVQPVPESSPVAPPSVGVPSQPASPTATFMSGYWDGWHGKWLGPIRWTLSDDYRQGHMLGSYDRKNRIDRYPSPK